MVVDCRSRPLNHSILKEIQKSIRNYVIQPKFWNLFSHHFCLIILQSEIAIGERLIGLQNCLPGNRFIASWLGKVNFRFKFKSQWYLLSTWPWPPYQNISLLNSTFECLKEELWHVWRNCEFRRACTILKVWNPRRGCSPCFRITSTGSWTPHWVERIHVWL